MKGKKKDKKAKTFNVGIHPLATLADGLAERGDVRW